MKFYKYDFKSSGSTGMYGYLYHQGVFFHLEIKTVSMKTCICLRVSCTV